MLQGQLVGLRARVDADIPVLHAQLHDDVVSHLLVAAGAWRPLPPDSADGPFSVKDVPDDVAPFSVIELGTGELAGSTLLWGIDSHNRHAHIGLSLLPAARGRGLGLDVLHVLCRYGFRLLGLHRLQIETASDNAAMQATARRAGFAQEGIQRQAYWSDGQFKDDVLFGLLASEYTA